MELLRNDLLRQLCEDKRVIWVVGDAPDQSESWAEAFSSAFEETRVEVVQMPTMIPKNQQWPRSAMHRSAEKRVAAA
jgi:hypothetical protein